MGMVDQAVINFACYEDAKDFLGLASVTLPDVDSVSFTHLPLPTLHIA